MALSQAQRAMIEKAQAVGSSRQGIALSESACVFLVGTIVADLGLDSDFPEFSEGVPPFFGSEQTELLATPGVAFLPLLERLVDLVPDADTYFVCLAKLHKSRLKFENILRTQPIPSLEQVGPRALIEFGKLTPPALGALLFWRKWIFDIDNRAAQETGYLFEPIIASAIGGVSVSAGRSPVRRRSNPKKGRQVDCIKNRHAYEFKLRVTIAASGQGRWREELEFPGDCRASSLVPVLLVLDATPNPKLDELREVFESECGDVYVGQEAWDHLNELAGPTMREFLKRYVHQPLQELLDAYPFKLCPLTISEIGGDLQISVGEESFKINRAAEALENIDPKILPNDVDEDAPGP